MFFETNKKEIILYKIHKILQLIINKRMFQQYNELTYSYEIADDYINLILGNCEKYIHDQQILKNAQKFAIYSAL